MYGFRFIQAKTKKNVVFYCITIPAKVLDNVLVSFLSGFNKDMRTRNISSSIESAIGSNIKPIMTMQFLMSKIKLYNTVTSIIYKHIGT